MEHQRPGALEGVGPLVVQPQGRCETFVELVVVAQQREGAGRPGQRPWPSLVPCAGEERLVDLDSAVPVARPEQRLDQLGARRQVGVADVELVEQVRRPR